MSRKKSVLFGILAVWLAVVAAGMGVIISYSNTAGAAGQPPTTWPEGCAAVRACDRHTLLMFVHPHCPCSRAALRELARLMSQFRGKLAAHVFFVQPSDKPGDWVRTDLWRSAERIPGVSVHCDTAGTLAVRFRAHTSGHVVLYDAAGRLRFHGGMTAGRGHEGGNAGRSAIESRVQGRETDRKTCPVFGCPLKDSH